MQYGPWVTLDLADLSTVTYGEMSPVDFIAADYNGHENKIYGYDSNYTFYAWDLDSGDVQAIGSAGNSIQITDMAYDYSSGILYAVGVDINSYMGSLYQVDVRTGKLLNAAMSMEGLAYFGLAIDLEGNIYILDMESKLYRVTVEEGMDWMTGEPVRYAVEELILETGFGDLNYTQSMCYDHDNDQIIWAACGAYSTMFWMDPATGEFAGSDITTQTKQSLTNVKNILEAAGYSLNDVVKTTVLLADIADFAAMNAVYAEFFTAPFPARAAFAVKDLPRGALVEIEAIAAK